MTRRFSIALSVVLAALLGAGTAAAFLVLTGRGYTIRVPGVSSSAPTPMAGTIGPSTSGTYWGVFLPGAQRDQSVITSFASGVGRRPAIVTTYLQWSGEPAFPTAAARWLERYGVVPLIVWEPWKPGLPAGQTATQPSYRLAVIAAGTFDRYVRQFADQARDYGGPLFLEPFHEMNGNWYPWGGTVNGNTTAEYIAAWRHVHDLFLSEGATNVTWVWTVNRDTVPSTATNQPAEYWPGPAYVDWVGLDAYNWGTAERKQWTSITQTFGPSLAVLQGYGKPIIVAETACAEVGGNKAVWIGDLFASLMGAYRGVISAAVWFDEPFGVFDWRINSSPAAYSAFRAGVALPGVLPASHVVFSRQQHSTP